MRILVGGAGYLGRRLAEFLALSGHDVFAVRRSAANDGEAATGTVRWLREDLGQPGAGWWPDPVEVLVICLPPSTPHYHGILESLTALVATRGVRHVVMTSSTGVYAESKGGWVDEISELDTASARGNSLVTAERIILNAHGPITTVLRCSGIYGPGRWPWHRYSGSNAPLMHDDGKHNDGLNHASRSDGSLAPMPPGTPVWSNRVHRDDAASAAQFVIEQALAGVFNVSDEEPAEAVTISDWIARQSRGVGSGTARGRLMTPAEPQAIGARALHRVDVSHPVPDFPRNENHRSIRGSNKRISSEKLRHMGWKLRFPTFREGWTANEADQAST